MAMFGNGSGRAWRERWTWELVRMAIAALIALGGAYWAVYSHINASNAIISRQHEVILKEVHEHCVHDEAVRVNQRIVLLDLLTLTDILNDRWRAGLRPVPSGLRDSILTALSNLPDQQGC